MSNVEIKLEMEDILNEDANDTKNDLPCDDEDLPPDMIPTEPEKKEFVWPEVTKCNVIGFVICGLCIAFFTILFFCSYFIPRSEYLDAKKQNPDHDFLEMQTTPLALYWTYYCCIMVLLFSLPFPILF